MAIDKFDKSFQEILKQEGGFSKHPKDTGGATNKGITIGTLSAYRGSNVTVNDVKALSNIEAKAIYKQRYWDTIRADEINDPQIANMIFDQTVNKGSRVAGHVQEILGLPRDNVIGSNTLAKLNSLTPEEQKAFKESFLKKEEQDYLNLVKRKPDQEVFLNGWIARLNTLAENSGVAPLSTPIVKRLKDNLGRGHKAYLGSDFVPDSADYREFDDSSSTQVEFGSFRFNDILLSIPPESIQIIINEHANSYHMLRSEAPASVQTGKKRIRIIVNFPVDVSEDTSGFFNLSKMAIQIRKTPIATIENEKIRKELFGNIKDFANIGVVVDNLTGYIEEDYPNLIRCTLQMTWFNHTPYVPELRYINELDSGEIITQQYPSRKYVDFYTNGTLVADRTLINNPADSYEDGNNSLVLLYKDYKSFNNVFSLTRSKDSSKLDPNKKEVSYKDYEEVQKLREQGWYPAEEEEKKWTEPVEGIFYRWLRFEIPFSDLNSSGSLILQNMSFSLSTNPSYINMEQHSVPTIQFLGGSSASLRAIAFAAAEYQSDAVRMPIATSSKLAELQMIFKQITENRLAYPKFSKENHLMIAHPLAKLMKYKPEAVNGYDYRYVDEHTDEIKKFNINNFLPVIVSHTDSSTVNGLPFASRFQIDFQETRIGKRKKAIRAIGEVGSAKGKTIYRRVIDKLVSKFSIEFDSKSKQWKYKATSLSADSIKAGLTVTALNNFLAFEPKATTLDAAFSSDLFFMSLDDIKSKLQSQGRTTLINQINTQARTTASSADRLKQRDQVFQKLKEAKKTDRVLFSKKLKNISFVFNQLFLNTFLLNFYMAFVKSLGQGEEWTSNYIEEFEEFVTFDPNLDIDLYPDMMIPPEESNPAFYFYNHVNRMTDYKKKMVQNLPGIAAKTDDNIRARSIQKGVAENIGTGGNLPGAENFPISFNMFTYQEMKDKGMGAIHKPNDQSYRILNAQRAIRDMSLPNHSLNQVYPTFQVQLFSDRYTFLQKYSASDVKANLLMEEDQKDLLDIFDLSSIIDIRIIKDESEAADVMVIRVLSTHKNLMNKTQDAFYDPDTFSVKSLFENVVGNLGQLNPTQSVDRFTNGVKNFLTNQNQSKSSVIQTYDSNLERAGLKEGIKIKALLGYVNDVNALSVEFSGRIAAINGSDVIEIYCIGNGHELIQNTLGFDKDSATYKLNSDSTDLMAKLLASAPEIKSFGNTKFEIGKGISFDFPLLAGGRSALDNIYAPTLHATGKTSENFVSGVFDTTLKSITYSVSAMGIASLIPIVAGAVAGISLLSVAALAGIVGFVGASIYQTYSFVKKKLNPGQFTVFQQTIWDVMQELTLRHPGFICAIVPFDNRSTIYFGEPDGTMFFRGPQSALEKIIKNVVYDSPRKTMREIYDQKAAFKDEKLIGEIDDPTMIISNASAKERLEKRKDKLKKAIQNADIEQLSLDSMQKSFRNYHLITSEHDIVANQIEASSKDVANSVQVYHPTDADDMNFDGTQYIKDYELTDPMKADDDLYSHLINNKIFTFHNAHEEFPGLELPQRYAKAILCKELEKIYKGKIVILGRPNIKPHDIAMLRDTYNDMSGPVGIRRVVQTLSPDSGWVTVIYPKFIAIPDSSAGAFQMSNVLKASRFLLGDEVDLFYSSMEKFNPTDNTGSSKQADDLSRAIDVTFNPNKQIDKDIMAERGEEHVAQVARIRSEVGAATVLAGQTAGGVVAPALVKGAITSATQTLGIGKAAASVAIAATKTAGIQAGAVNAAGGLLNTGLSAGKTLLKVGGAGVAGVAGFGMSYLLDSAIEGFISWAKYRQPVYIFPLKKEGRPWMAALNGFKENTPLEHLELQATQAADVLGSYSYYVRDFLSGFLGGNPNTTRLTFNETFGSIIDGDTFRLKTGEVIRLTGYDTAEKTNTDGHQPLSDEIHMAKLATKALENMLTGQPLKVERTGKDRHGRTLANIKVGNVDISEQMIKTGLVFRYKGELKGADPERDSRWTDLRKKGGF